MSIEFGNTELTELTPRIAVVGVGGAGCNAVNNMIAAQLQGVDFVVANTDAQSLAASTADNRIQLGVQITQGLGAGAQPKVGEAAAEEALERIDEILDGCHMAFITAGMGGGTGTGAAPVIARRARERGILTVGVVTKPFQFEGGRRMKIADAGIQELAKHVDTLIIIPNQNLFRVANERTTFADAFNMADEVLHSGVRGITDLMVMPGLINLDFADVRTVMSEMGKAMMGTGEAEGDSRAQDAAAAAISNPLLEEASLKGAKGVIINVTGGMDMTLYEVDEAVNMVREQVDQDALIVFGSAFNPELEGKLRVSVVATGIQGVPGSFDMPLPEKRVIAAVAPEKPEPAVAAPLEAEEKSVLDAIADAISERNTDEDRGSNIVDLQSADEDIEDEAADFEVEDIEVAAEEEPAPVRRMLPDIEGDATAEDDLESKAVAAKAEETFVVDAPMMPKASMEPVLAAPLHSNRTEAYSAVGTSANDSTPAPAAAPSVAPQKRSLFQVMTAGLRGNDAASEATPQSTVDMPVSEDEEGATIGRVSADDRPAPKSSVSQLEIPSFLRRQQN